MVRVPGGPLVINPGSVGLPASSRQHQRGRAVGRRVDGRPKIATDRMEHRRPPEEHDGTDDAGQTVTSLRSVLMKPEHLDWVSQIVEILQRVQNA